jgi:hypothetical protein
MASSLASRRRAVVAVRARADEARRAGGGLDSPSGSGSGDATAGVEVVVEVGDSVGDGADGLDVDEVVNAVAAARGVPAGDERSAQVSILDGEGD